MGWNGKVIARMRYAWERSRVDNWQNDLMQTYYVLGLERHRLL
jgi:hypothetical protein